MKTSSLSCPADAKRPVRLAWLPGFPAPCPRYPLLRLTSPDTEPSLAPSRGPPSGNPKSAPICRAREVPSGTSGDGKVWQPAICTVVVVVYNNGGRAAFVVEPACHWRNHAQTRTPTGLALNSLVQYEDHWDDAAAAPAGDSHGPTRQAARLRGRATLGNSRSPCLAKSR